MSSACLQDQRQRKEEEAENECTERERGFPALGSAAATCETDVYAGDLCVPKQKQLLHIHQLTEGSSGGLFISTRREKSQEAKYNR